MQFRVEWNKVRVFPRRKPGDPVLCLSKTKMVPQVSASDLGDGNWRSYQCRFFLQLRILLVPKKGRWIRPRR